MAAAGEEGSAQGIQTLTRCLAVAIEEPDLVADIIEACRLSHTSATDLAGWAVEDIASKLYLTPDEAISLSGVCKAVSEQGASALGECGCRSCAGGGQARTGTQHAQACLCMHTHRHVCRPGDWCLPPLVLAARHLMQHALPNRRRCLPAA